MPIVSKKSDSMTDRIAAIAVQKLSTLNTLKLKLPTRSKSGDATMFEGIWAIPFVHTSLSPQTMLMTIATSVPKAMPIRIAPRTLRATKAAVRASVMKNTRILSVVRSGAIVIGVPGADDDDAGVVRTR